MAGKSSYQKLKERLEAKTEQHRAFRQKVGRYIYGELSFDEMVIFELGFKTDRDCEKLMWAGDTTKNGR